MSTATQCPVASSEAIGWRVEVYWDGDDKWFAGVVTAVDSAGKMTVLYDDGDIDTIHVDEDELRWLHRVDIEDAIKSHSNINHETRAFMKRIEEDLKAKGVVDPMHAIAMAMTSAARTKDGTDSSSSDEEDSTSGESTSDDSQSDSTSSDSDDSESEAETSSELQSTQEKSITHDGAKKSRQRAKHRKSIDETIPVKWVFGTQIRKAHVSVQAEFQIVYVTLQHQFGESLTLEYCDEEGDFVSITNTEDLRLAFDYFRQLQHSSDSPPASLRLFVKTPNMPASMGNTRVLGQSSSTSGLPSGTAHSLGHDASRTTLNSTHQSCFSIAPTIYETENEDDCSADMPSDKGLLNSRSLDTLHKRNNSLLSGRPPLPNHASSAFSQLSNNEAAIEIVSARQPARSSRPATTTVSSRADSEAVGDTTDTRPSTMQHNLRSKFDDTQDTVSGTEAIVAAGGITHWQKGQLIGSGSYGKVYSALDLASGTQIAVKQVHIVRGAGDIVDQREKEIEALEREIDLLRELNHPNIIKYLGTQRTQRKLFIFLEYASSGSVSAALARFGPFSEAVMRRYTLHILKGLEYLHKHGIIHRDIKGSNLLLDNGIVKLADFGCSKRVALSSSGATEEQHTAIGTTQYMAPEIMKEEGTYGRKADIWSLGITVIEMATGKPPWSNPAHAIYKICMTDDLPPVPASLSLEAHDFLKQCLQRDPANRPDAAQLLEHPFLYQPSQHDEADVSFFRSTRRSESSTAKHSFTDLNETNSLSSSPSNQRRLASASADDDDSSDDGFRPEMEEVEEMISPHSLASPAYYQTATQFPTATWIKQERAASAARQHHGLNEEHDDDDDDIEDESQSVDITHTEVYMTAPVLEFETNTDR